MSTITRTNFGGQTQRMTALDRANTVRIGRGRIKHDVKAGRARVPDLLLNPPEHLHGMRVVDLLMATPRVGRVKANKMLKRMDISSTRQIGELTDRQREQIARLVP